jgi:hypothetical protein
VSGNYFAGYSYEEWFNLPESRRKQINAEYQEHRRQISTPKVPDELTIYDVLIDIVNYINWREETLARRYIQAIQKAKTDHVFGIEGNYKI